MVDSKVKPRPIVRLVVLLMSHRVIVSFLFFFAGIIALLLLPALAKSTYISENALMPGSVTSMLSRLEVSEASDLVSDIIGLHLKAKNSGREIPVLLADHIASLGAEVGQFQSYQQPDKFHPLNFFSNPSPGSIQGNMTCTAPSISTFGIIRAPRGDGKEAIVLVTPYNASDADTSEVLSLGVAYSVFSLLTKVTWLAKDIIWLAADSRYGEYDAVSAWLQEYISPSFVALEKTCADTTAENVASDNNGGFIRAGTMAAALVIKVVNNDKISEDTLSIYAEATNGQMPNLDLINVVNYLGVHRQGLRVKVDKFWSIIGSKYVGAVGQTIEFLGKVAGSLNSDWKFGIPAAEYAEGTATLASSLYSQALGIPTGPHGAFRDYQIDAVTLAISQKFSHHNTAKQSEFLMRSGRLIEGVIRSVNNLLEKFHQSFFLYLLTGPSKFVSVGVYMIAFALLIAPLPVVAASLYSETIKSDSTLKPEAPSSAKSWKWLHAAKWVFIVHSWALIVSLLPFFICQIPNRTPTTSLLSWVFLSVFSLQFLYTLLGSPSLHHHKWAILKSVMISAAFIGLCLMSIVNYATAQIGALMLVLLCLMAQPLRSDLRAGTFKTYARAASNLVLGFIGFPPATFFLLKGMTGSFSVTDFSDFWNWAESLWMWNSATYLYMVVVHLPCWVLCIHVLFHPC
ncbi:hypothetical protein V2J09_004241 [Rumex salicifolius]